MGCLGLGWQGQALAVLAELEVEGLVPVLAGWAVLQVRGPELVVLALALVHLAEAVLVLRDLLLLLEVLLLAKSEVDLPVLYYFLMRSGLIPLFGMSECLQLVVVLLYKVFQPFLC